MTIRGNKFHAMLFFLTAIAVLVSGCSSSTTPEPQYANEYERLQALNGTGDLDVQDQTFVIGLTYAATLEGLRAAASGAPGTFAMGLNDYVAFFWQSGNYPAFVVIDVMAEKPIENFALKMGGSGQVTDIRSMTGLINYMKDSGWVDVSKNQVPRWVAAAAESQTTWIAAMGTSTLPTFILLPTWVDVDDILEKYYPEIDT